jgi:DNA-3-methyladenine glycosylase
MLLQRSFYLRNDVVEIARDLLGKFLVTNFDGYLTSGMITETEAYAGEGDKASHAYGGRNTTRTEVMFRQGGTAYIYLCYGVHSLFNVVTNNEGIPHAVLVRALEPVDGIGFMEQRMGRNSSDKHFADGPGKLAKALGIHYYQSGADLCISGNNLLENKIWIEERSLIASEKKIITTARIGIDYAGRDAILPYRFILK